MGRRARGVVRVCRVLLLLGLVAVLLGVGPPMLSRPSATAADSRVDALPAAPALVLPDAAVTLRARGPVGYHGTAAPTPLRAPAATSPAAASSSAAPTRAAAAARGTPAGPRSSAVPAAPAAPSAVAATGAVLPLKVATGSSTQLITVVAPSSSATTAQLTAWQKGPSGWTVVLGPVPAKVGAQGIGKASETTSRTPAGTFTLTEGFGRNADPGTALNYRTINADDYWVSDVASPLYNHFEECAPGTCPFRTAAGEHLWDAGASYAYAVVIDYNRWPAVPGAGSAFFLHVTNGAATAGCVAIAQTGLVTIMRWLNPSARPLIAIGIG